MELVDVDIWARGVAHVLDYGGEGTKPWPVFQDERRVQPKVHRSKTKLGH
ncbi:hypothetical protein ABTY61_40260 [Kitasatospora sp. NPDC096128]